MKFWDYIKDKLFNKKKYLPEPKDNTVNITGINSKKQAFDEVLNVDIDIRPNTLDWAIDQYMLSLIAQENSGKGVSPYNALIQLGALRDLYSGNNKINQSEFLEFLDVGLYGKNAILRNIQRNRINNEPEFYHISNSDINPDNIKYRIYLNCKKENIALLAKEFAKELENNDYYFKFVADEMVSERSEQFVFYMRDEDELNANMMAIDKIKQKNPKLFEGSYNVNPFLKTVNAYIAYAPEAASGKYIDFKGEEHEIDQSYNTLLSNALEDSFVDSTKEIAINELNIDLSQYSNIYQILSSKFLETIYEDNNLKVKFIESVKRNLKLASERNPELDIKGIDTKSKNPEKSISDNIPENY